MCRKSPVCVCEADGKAGVTWIVYVSDRGKRQEWNKEERRENGGRIDRLTEPRSALWSGSHPARGHAVLTRHYYQQPLQHTTNEERERDLIYSESFSGQSPGTERERQRERERDGQAFMFTHCFGRWTPSERLHVQIGSELLSLSTHLMRRDEK